MQLNNTGQIKDSSDINSFKMDRSDILKQEPVDGASVYQELGPPSASVPIPGSYRGPRNNYDQLSPSPLTNPALWGNNQPGDFLLEPSFMLESQDQLDPVLSFKMDDDDIFQVDKADLIQGPTLAELNANEDTLLGDLNFDDLLLPNENIQPVQTSSYNDFQTCNNSLSTTSNSGIGSNSFPQTVQVYRNNSINPNASSNFNTMEMMNTCDPTESGTISKSNKTTFSDLTSSPTANATLSSHLISKPFGETALHEILVKKENIQSSLPRQVENSNVFSTKSKISRLSMSAPSQSIGFDQIWERREPRKHLLSTGSLGPEAGSSSSLSTGSALSPNPINYLEPFSHDEGYEDSDEDSDNDHYDDCSSDNDSENSDIEDRVASGTLNEATFKESKQKREKYFWQYNIQAKGPKGQRLVARSRLENPHVLNEATDPVFSPNCALRGIKHSGKARKGDGNDLTPNPRKLNNIGKELDKLSRIINDMTPVSELPFTVRPKTRKEKNKLASRACRLKKKAQHEANKIKLHGLEQEHKRLINGISQAKQLLATKLNACPEAQEELTRQMDKIYRNATKVRIANHSTEFVNKVLENVKAGVPDGGIDDF